MQLRIFVRHHKGRDSAFPGKTSARNQNFFVTAAASFYEKLRYIVKNPIKVYNRPRDLVLSSNQKNIKKCSPTASPLLLLPKPTATQSTLMALLSKALPSSAATS